MTPNKIHWKNFKDSTGPEVSQTWPTFPVWIPGCTNVHLEPQRGIGIWTNLAKKLKVHYHKKQEF
jgi:hypothetical protein